VLDHNNLEEFADPVNYDRADPVDTGVAFYSALAREAGGSVLSCTWQPPNAGTMVGGSTRRPHVPRCVIPSRRSLRRCCTTTVSPFFASTEIGTKSRSAPRARVSSRSVASARNREVTDSYRAYNPTADTTLLTYIQRFGAACDVGHHAAPGDATISQSFGG
jgi:hypothetical protein